VGCKAGYQGDRILSRRYPPRDLLLPACVSMGIYDLVVEGTPLAAALWVHSTYADVSRWHLPAGQLRVRERRETAPAEDVQVQ